MDNTAFVSDKNMNEDVKTKQIHADHNGVIVTKLQPEEHADTTCGIMGLAPKWMRRFTQPKWLLVALCMLCCIQGFVVNGINNVNTTSYERRFQLSAKQASAVSSAYDFSAGILVLPASYFGAFVHKPRLLGIAAVVMGIGSFSMSLPHFITANYEAGEGINKLCDATVSKCDASYLSNFLYLLIFGQLLHGFAGTVLYTVGISAIDDNVSDKTSPFYLGILYCFAALGPAIGYVGGGQALSLYVDIDKGVDVTLTDDDPRWVGAWWIGFIIAFVLAFIMGSLFFFFPRESPKASKLRAERAKTNPDGQEQAQVSLRDSVKDIPGTTIRLLKSPTFIFISLSGITEAIVTSGFGTFMPKFIKNQYNQTDNMAALITGALAIPGMAGGMLLGGYILKRTEWKVKGMLRFNSVVSFIVVALAAVLFAQCPQAQVAGVNLPYDLTPRDDFTVNMTSKCNADCGCNKEHYDPICLDGKYEYFTPCFAGCRNVSHDASGKKVYQDCSCMADYMSAQNSTSVAGKCGSSCVYFYLFIPMFFLMMLFTFLAGTPAVSATVRCISDKDKTYALGVQWVFVRFLGSVPGPLLFGVIIDHVCVLWQEICGESKSCWIYDNTAMSRNIFLISVACKALSGVFFAFGAFFYKPINTVDVLMNGDRVKYGSQGGEGVVNEESVETTL